MAPPKRDTEGVLIRLHRNTLNALDQMIEADPNHPSRQELVRHILIDWFAQKGIDARE